MLIRVATKYQAYAFFLFPNHLAKIKNCELLTTEKDYFRLKKSFRKNINYLKVELSVEQKKLFYKYLNERL